MGSLEWIGSKMQPAAFIKIILRTNNRLLMCLIESNVMSWSCMAIVQIQESIGFQITNIFHTLWSSSIHIYYVKCHCGLGKNPLICVDIPLLHQLSLSAKYFLKITSLTSNLKATIQDWYMHYTCYISNLIWWCLSKLFQITCSETSYLMVVLMCVTWVAK